MFVGLSDHPEDGTWSYSNGESLVYSNWKSSGSRVKRNLHKKNCVIVDKKRKWRNKICSKRKARFLCEQDIGAEDERRSPPKRDISNNKSKEKKRRKSRLKNRQSDERPLVTRQKDSKKYSRTNRRGFFFNY